MRDMNDKFNNSIRDSLCFSFRDNLWDSLSDSLNHSCIGDMFDRDTTDNLIARYIINKSEDTSALRKGSLLDYIKLLGVVQQTSEKEMSNA